LASTSKAVWSSGASSGRGGTRVAGRGALGGHRRRFDDAQFFLLDDVRKLEPSLTAVSMRAAMSASASCALRCSTPGRSRRAPRRAAGAGGLDVLHLDDVPADRALHRAHGGALGGAEDSVGDGGGGGALVGVLGLLAERYVGSAEAGLLRRLGESGAARDLLRKRSCGGLIRKHHLAKHPSLARGIGRVLAVGLEDIRIRRLGGRRDLFAPERGVAHRAALRDGVAALFLVVERRDLRVGRFLARAHRGGGHDADGAGAAFQKQRGILKGNAARHEGRARRRQKQLALEQPGLDLLAELVRVHLLAGQCRFERLLVELAGQVLKGAHARNLAIDHRPRDGEALFLAEHHAAATPTIWLTISSSVPPRRKVPRSSSGFCSRAAASCRLTCCVTSCVVISSPPTLATVPALGAAQAADPLPPVPKPVMTMANRPMPSTTSMIFAVMPRRKKESMLGPDALKLWGVIEKAGAIGKLGTRRDAC
jgi:hypothetical protein